MPGVFVQKDVALQPECRIKLTTESYESPDPPVHALKKARETPQTTNDLPWQYPHGGSEMGAERHSAICAQSSSIAYMCGLVDTFVKGTFVVR